MLEVDHVGVLTLVERAFIASSEKAYAQKLFATVFTEVLRCEFDMAYCRSSHQICSVSVLLSFVAQASLISCLIDCY